MSMAYSDKQLQNLLKVAVLLTENRGWLEFKRPLNYRLFFFRAAGVGVWTLLFKPWKAEAQFREFYGITPEDSILFFPEEYTNEQRRAHVLTHLMSLFEGLDAFGVRYNAIRLPI